MDRETFAKKLKAARETAGYKQGYVARIIGVSRAAISQWEKGKRTPSAYNVIKLSKLYGVNLLDDYCSERESTEKERGDVMDNNNNSNNNLAALGVALGAMGMNSNRMEQGPTHAEADKTCLKALSSMAETMDALNNLIKGAENPDEFAHENIMDLADRMSNMATSMSTLRMSMGLGYNRGPGGTMM